MDTDKLLNPKDKDIELTPLNEE
jgi:hypothetical protein